MAGVRRNSLTWLVSFLLLIAVVLSPLPVSAQSDDTDESVAVTAPCPYGATIIGSQNATLIRTPPPTGGSSLSGGGSFSEKEPDVACDPVPRIAPTTIQSGGVFSITLDGSPAVPCRWSLRNHGAGITVNYIPTYGENDGPAEEIASLRLRCEEESVGGDDTHVDVQGVAPGPGRLEASVIAPAGTGPLTGNCFGQGFNMSVKMVEAFPESLVRGETLLLPGDTVRTPENGHVLMEFGATGSMAATGEIKLHGDAPPTPESVVAGQSLVLDSPTEQTPIGELFGQSEKDGLLHPAIRDFRQFDQETLFQARQLLTSSPSKGANRCLDAMEATLLLNTHASDVTVHRLGAAAWTVFGWDQYDAAEWVTKMSLPKLLPFVSALGALDDLQDRMELFQEYVQRQQLSELWSPALEEWQNSRELTTTAEVDARIETIRTARANILERRQGAAAREVEALNALLDEPYYANLKRAWNQAVANAAKRTSETGVKQPVVFIWPAGLEGVRINYQSRVREIKQKTKEEMFNLMFEAQKLDLAAKVLQDYRAPLAEMSCEEFLKQRAMEQPTLSACKNSARSVSLIEGLMHYLGATEYRDGDVQRYLGMRGYHPGDETPVQVDGRWIYPKGTEYVAVKDAEGGRISVLQGSVVVVDENGAEIEVNAGEQLTWPGDTISAYDPAQDDALLNLGVDLRNQLLGDAVAVEAGEYRPVFHDDQIPDDWVWQDPGNDSRIQTTEEGALRLTVPPENDLWQGRADAPRLLRKVTGDFDLQGELFLESEGTHLAIAEFLLAAPGSALGYLAGQQPLESASSQYRILGGGWLKMDGMNKLAALACTQQPSSIRECDDAPATAVHFRLSRRGDQWRTYYSLDGTNWQLSTQQDFAAPDTLWVGWVIKRMAYDGMDVPAIVTLKDVQLTVGPEGNLLANQWSFAGLNQEGVHAEVAQIGETGVLPSATADTTLSRVAAVAEDLQDGAVDGSIVDTLDAALPPNVTLSLDGTQLAHVSAYTTHRVTDDFDIIVRADVEPYEEAPGDSRAFQLRLRDNSDKTWIYVGYAQTPNRHIFNTDYFIEGMGQGYYEIPVRSSPSTYYRLVQSGNLISALVWDRCDWLPLHAYEGAPESPLTLQVQVGNEWDAAQPAAFEVVFTVERLAAGDDFASHPSWQPPACSVLQALDLPKTLALPDGLSARSYIAPFALGNLFFDEAGTAYLFSSSKGEQSLIALEPDGKATIAMTNELLAGVNAKAGVAVEDGFLVVVDNWPEGGNSHGGLYLLQGDGVIVEVPLGVSTGGLAEIIPAKGEGWLLSDFEVGGIWHLPNTEADAKSLVDESVRLRGIGGIGYELDSERLLALYDANWSSSGTTGVYAITPDAQVETVVDAPVGIENLSDLAIADDDVLPAGIYLTDPANGTIVKLDAGMLKPVISGLLNPTKLDFNRHSGQLLVLYDSDKVLVIERN